MTAEQQKFHDIKNTSDYKVVGEDIDYKIIVDDTKEEVILLFKESDSREDWVNNLLFIPWPVQLGKKKAWVTYGYARAYISAADAPMLDFLDAINKNPYYKAVIRGWSFGSAMAKISARHFYNLTGYPVDELTTFGDVKCWFNPFFKNKAGRLREYVTANDFVTWCVPFYHRDKKCKVGAKFRIKEIFKTEYYHTHYDTYDYSRWENE